MATTVKYYYGNTLLGEGTVAPEYPLTTSAIPAGEQVIKRELWVDGDLKDTDTVNVTVDENEPENRIVSGQDLDFWYKRGSHINSVGNHFEYVRTAEGWDSYIRLPWTSFTPTDLIKFGFSAKYVDVQYLVFLQIISVDNDLSVDLINGTVSYKRNTEIPVTITDEGDGWWKIEITSVPSLKNEFQFAPYVQLNSSPTGMTNSSASNVGSCLLRNPFLYQL